MKIEFVEKTSFLTLNRSELVDFSFVENFVQGNTPLNICSSYFCNIKLSVHFNHFFKCISKNELAKVNQREVDHRGFKNIEFSYRMSNLIDLNNYVLRKGFTDEELISLIIAMKTMDQDWHKKTKVIKLMQNIIKVYSDSKNYKLKFLLILISDKAKQDQMLQLFLADLANLNDSTLKAKLMLNSLLLCFQNKSSAFDVDYIFEEAITNIDIPSLFKISSNIKNSEDIFESFLSNTLKKDINLFKAKILLTPKLLILELKRDFESIDNNIFFDFVDGYMKNTHLSITKTRLLTMNLIEIYNDNPEYIKKIIYCKSSKDIFAETSQDKDIFLKEIISLVSKEHQDMILNMIFRNQVNLTHKSTPIKETILEDILKKYSVKNIEKLKKESFVNERDFMPNLIYAYLESSNHFKKDVDVELIKNVLDNPNYSYSNHDFLFTKKTLFTDLFMKFFEKYSDKLDYDKIFKNFDYYSALETTTQGLEILFTYFSDKVNVFSKMDSLLKKDLNEQLIEKIRQLLTDNIAYLYEDGDLIKQRKYQETLDKFYSSNQFKDYEFAKHQRVLDYKLSFENWVELSIKNKTTSLALLNKFLTQKYSSNEEISLTMYKKYIKATTINDLEELTNHVCFIKKINIFIDTDIDSAIVQKLINSSTENTINNNTIVSFLNNLGTKMPSTPSVKEKYDLGDEIPNIPNVKGLYNSIYNNYTDFIKYLPELNLVYSNAICDEFKKDIVLIPDIKYALDLIELNEFDFVKNNCAYYILFKKLYPNVILTNDIVELIQNSNIIRPTKSTIQGSYELFKNVSFQTFVTLNQACTSTHIYTTKLLANYDFCNNVLKSSDYRFTPIVVILNKQLMELTKGIEDDFDYNSLLSVLEHLNTYGLHIIASSDYTVKNISKHSKTILNIINKRLKFANGMSQNIIRNFVTELTSLCNKDMFTDMIGLLNNITNSPLEIYKQISGNTENIVSSLLLLNQEVNLDQNQVLLKEPIELTKLLLVGPKAIRIYQKILTIHKRDSIKIFPQNIANLAVKLVTYIEDLGESDVDSILSLSKNRSIDSKKFLKKMNVCTFKKLFPIINGIDDTSIDIIENILKFTEQFEKMPFSKTKLIISAMSKEELANGVFINDPILIRIFKTVSNVPITTLNKNKPKLENVEISNVHFQEVVESILKLYRELNNIQKINFCNIINECGHIRDVNTICKNSYNFNFSNKHHLEDHIFYIENNKENSIYYHNQSEYELENIDDLIFEIDNFIFETDDFIF